MTEHKHKLEQLVPAQKEVGETPIWIDALPWRAWRLGETIIFIKTRSVRN